MATTMNISLPEAMRQYVETQVAEGSFSSTSEYFRALVREDQKRKAQERLEALLLDGLDSGEPIEVTPEWLEKKRQELRARRATSPQELAAERLRAQLPPPSQVAHSELLPVRDERGIFHPERLEAAHQFFDRASKGLPAIPLEALRREVMYEDHD